MRYLQFLFILMFSLALSSCGEKLEKEVEMSWPDGSERKIVYYDMIRGERTKVREDRFYANGQQEMTGGYNGIKKEGDWMYWFEDGKKWSQATYKNDIKEGKAVVWRENGNKNYEGSYATGKPHGTWVFYDIDGSRLKEVLFEYGQKINEIEFKSGVPFDLPAGDSIQVKIK